MSGTKQLTRRGRMHRAQFIILVLAFALAPLPYPARAQELELGGFMEIDHLSYLKDADEGKINSRNQALLQLELGSSVSDQAAVFSALEFRDDQADPVRNRVYLDEAYLDLYLGDFDFRIGKQVVAWGKADGINPTDNISPWDFSDYLDTEDERIGVAALKGSYYIGNWTAEGILVPAFTPSVLPGENSRWFPTLPASAPNPMYPASGPPVLSTSYTFLDPLLPDEDTKSYQFGMKLSASIRGWDLSASYFSGWNDLPVFHRAASISADSLRIEVQPEHHRRRTIGLDFSTTLGKLGLRGEGAYHITEDPDGLDPEVDDPYFQYVVGLDRTFSDFIGDNNLFVLVQWIQEISDEQPTPGSDNLNHIFRKSVSALIEYELSAFTRLEFQGVYNVDDEDFYLRPEISYDVVDGVTVNIAADILCGERESFFGSFRDNRRVQARIKYSF